MQMLLHERVWRYTGKIMMVMQALLQKPHAKSKAKEHTLLLDRRSKQWADGDTEGLLSEGYTIQHKF